MSTLLRVACLQMCSTTSVEQNLGVIESALAQATEQGAELIQLPENFAQMPAKRKHQHIELDGQGVVQEFLSAQAKQHQLVIVAGALAVREQADSKPYARCLVYDASGKRQAHYDKIHLFDVDVPAEQTQHRYRESDSYSPGSQVVSKDIELGEVSVKLGLSICYDLRFPELYRRLCGAQLVVAPSAFTLQTGEAHWQTLLQARAIENQVFMMAAAQDGTHDNGRQTWGHSMIVDPWGQIIAQKESGQGLLIADLDLTQIADLQQSFPVHQHRRLNNGT